jgi:hypothetical protein
VVLVKEGENSLDRSFERNEEVYSCVKDKNTVYTIQLLQGQEYCIYNTTASRTRKLYIQYSCVKDKNIVYTIQLRQGQEYCIYNTKRKPN